MSAAQTRWIARLAGVLLGAGLLLGPAAPAVADGVDTAATQLQSASLYIEPGAELDVSGPATVAAALRAEHVKVAILAGEDAASAEQRLQRALSPPVTLAVLTDQGYRVASSQYCQSNVEQTFISAVRPGSGRPSADQLAAGLTSFARGLGALPASGSAQCSSAGSGSGSASGSASSGSSHTWIWAVVLVVLVGGGTGGYLVSRRRRQRRLLSDARAAVMPYYDRLASEVNLLDPGQDATARQALADASERYTSAGGQLAEADSVEKYRIARRTTLEGLTAARTARTALGLDPGPDIPPVDEARGEQLSAPQQVSVQGQDFQGYPVYTPGAPYFFGGGYGVPGGWYATPFWETLLVGSMLGGGLGWGGGFGGGYGYGYDNGYQTGYDAGQNSVDNGGAGDWGSGGGDWGSGGGGDWGSGGGDWGGGGGGGDWGGGGGSDGGSW